MFKRFFIFLTLMVCTAFSLCSSVLVFKPFHELVSYQVFPGDKEGRFKGDLVIILEDGSFWKVHPESKEIYKEWDQGDAIQVMAREDFYFFKREHKFRLYNHDKEKSVKAMLVCYPDYPKLRIVFTELFYDSKEQPCRKIIQLSDGSYFVIERTQFNFQEFSVGQRVYIGAQKDCDGVENFILIVGIQERAIYSLAIKLS